MNIAWMIRLRQAGGGFVPWEELETAGPDIHQNLDELEAFGFGIERHPAQGVAYRGPSPRLCPDQIEWDLKTRIIGRRVAVWNRVVSTNDLASRAASSLSNEGLAILAEEQTAGRGSRGRTWSSPPGSSILMSVLLFPRNPLDDPGWLTALGAVAVAEVVVEEFGLDARIKWPNDVRVDHRKLSGILVERGRGTVLGIGLNGNIPPEEFPEDLRDSATSLQKLLGRLVDRSEVAHSLLKKLDHLYTMAIEAGPEPLWVAYRSRSEHLGRRVRVATSSGSCLGVLESIDHRDGLRILLDDGTVREVSLREVGSILNE